MSERIKFYSTTGEFGCFSNFSAHPIRVDGQRWPTSEHYFQGQKFEDERHREEIRRAKSPMIAARLGRSRKKPLRRDWESVKDDVMRQAVRAKFEQHDDLRAILLETGDADLVEHTTNDSYWGDGSGRNMLGRILMETRAALREAETDEAR